MVAKRDDTTTSKLGGAGAAPWQEEWQDYYAVLGVDRSASADQIRRAYEERSLLLDPARFGDAPANVLERARREFALLARAYAVLSDTGLRELYDEEFRRLASFRAGRSPAEAALTPPIRERATEVRAAPVGQVGGIEPKPWGIPAILAVLAIPTLFWLSGFFIDVPEEQTTEEIALGLVTTIIFKDFLLIGLAAAFALWRYGAGWQSLGFRPFDRQLWWLPLAVVVGAFVGVIVYVSILVAAGVSDPEQEAVQAFFESKALLPLTFLALVVMAPLSEEIFFRGFIFAGLVRPLGLLPAIAISGFLFGGAHVSGLETLPLLLPFGAIGGAFAWLYVRTGSLWPAIAAHALFNAVGFAQGAFS